MLTDRQTDRRTDDLGYNIMPPNFGFGGIKTAKSESIGDGPKSVSCHLVTNFRGQLDFCNVGGLVHFLSYTYKMFTRFYLHVILYELTEC